MDGVIRRKWLGRVLLVLLVLTSGWVTMQWLGTTGSPFSGVEVSSLQQRYQQLRESGSSMGGSWLRTLNPLMKDVQGGLIWVNEQQQGVMRFLNLPDPKRGFEYRLWIHDSRAEQGEPILGAQLQEGSGKQERFVELAAVGKVYEPFKFVLTMEPLGNTSSDQADDTSIMLMVQP